ncbi:MAG TPA: ribokinase [Ilumatobacteraceae bacterium]|nr:ribokinase [Ilumatobacteraceae bacterium]
MSSPFDVVVVGSANLDLVATVDRLPGPGETVPGSSYAEYPGGKGLNQAVAAARAGASVAFVGAVGSDAAAATLLDVMHQDGIDTANVATADQPTGRALIGVAASGENSIVVVAGANATVTAHTVPASRVVLSQLEVPVAAIERAFTAARDSGATTVLNPAPASAIPESLLALCDVVVPNEHEVELLGGFDHLLDLGAKAVVVTLGARGAALHTRDGDTPIAPFEVTPVDTTGAGDTFCGALCARLAAGDELEAALRVASAAAALSTTKAGAVPSIPTRAEIDALMGV